LSVHTRLRIATRIHFALMHRLGEGIDVGAMLKHEAHAREVLWVCEALGDPELLALARQFIRVGTLAENASPATGHAAHETPWARDTSGFGLTRPPELPDPAEPQLRKRDTPVSPNWLNPVGWLRRGQHDPR
jgi:hypothetical protein